MKENKTKRKVMIVGRSGSGKDTIAVMLSKMFGYKQLLSTTTRPRRFPDEATHVFVTEDEANKMTERVAATVIDGYQYFATVGQFEECDIYIIDPIGLDCVCKNVQDQELCVVYVSASEEARLRRAKARAADENEAEKVFVSRNANEDSQFTEFENLANGNFEDFQKAYGTASVLFKVCNDEDDLGYIERAAIAIHQYGDVEHSLHTIK